MPLDCRDGKVEESHSTQSVLQGPQKRHQETQEASPHFHQRGILFYVYLFSGNLIVLFFKELFYEFLLLAIGVDGSQVSEESEVREEAQQEEW